MILHSILKEYNIDKKSSNSSILSGCLGNKSNVFMLSEKHDLNHSVSLWKVTRDKPVIRLNCKAEVSGLKFAMDDKSAQTGHLTGNVTTWDLDSCKASRAYEGHQCEVTNIAPEKRFGQLFASSGFDTKVKLWDSRQQHSILTLRNHAYHVTQTQISPNSKFILSGDALGQVKLQDLTANKFIWEQREGTSVKSLQFNPTQYKFTVSSDDNIIKTQDFYNTIKLESFTEKPYKNQDRLCVTRGGHNLISLGSKVSIYDLENKDQSGPFKINNTASFSSELTGFTDAITYLNPTQFYLQSLHCSKNKVTICKSDLYQVNLNLKDVQVKKSDQYVKNKELPKETKIESSELNNKNVIQDKFKENEFEASKPTLNSPMKSPIKNSISSQDIRSNKKFQDILANVQNDIDIEHYKNQQSNQIEEIKSNKKIKNSNYIDRQLSNSNYETAQDYSNENKKSNYQSNENNDLKSNQKEINSNESKKSEDLFKNQKTDSTPNHIKNHYLSNNQASNIHNDSPHFKQQSENIIKQNIDKSEKKSSKKNSKSNDNEQVDALHQDQMQNMFELKIIPSNESNQSASKFSNNIERFSSQFKSLSNNQFPNRNDYQSQNYEIPQHTFNKVDDIDNLSRSQNNEQRKSTSNQGNQPTVLKANLSSKQNQPIESKNQPETKSPQRKEMFKLNIEEFDLSIKKMQNRFDEARNEERSLKQVNKSMPELNLAYLRAKAKEDRNDSDNIKTALNQRPTNQSNMHCPATSPLITKCKGNIQKKEIKFVPLDQDIEVVTRDTRKADFVQQNQILTASKSALNFLMKDRNQQVYQLQVMKRQAKKLVSVHSRGDNVIDELSKIHGIDKEKKPMLKDAQTLVLDILKIGKEYMKCINIQNVDQVLWLLLQTEDGHALSEDALRNVDGLFRQFIQEILDSLKNHDGQHKAKQQKGKQIQSLVKQQQKKVEQAEHAKNFPKLLEMWDWFLAKIEYNNFI